MFLEFIHFLINENPSNPKGKTDMLTDGKVDNT